MRPLRVLGSITVVLAATATATGVGYGQDAGQTTTERRQVTHKDFDPANFSDGPRIDNEWLPMTPGTQLVFRGKSNRGEGLKQHRVVFTVTDLTKVMNGVRANVIWDQDINQGELLESEIAFNAQDDDGNVWLLGEYPAELEDGKFKRAPDTWIAGVDDAQAGILMRADPQPGTSSYFQGLAPEIEFKDKAKVEKTGRKACVPFDCFTDVLLIKEWNPLEPQEGSQLKYYGPGIGNIQVGAVGGKEKEVLVLVDVRQLGAEELAQARDAALELETHAYEGSRVYRDTTPLELCTAEGQCTPAA